MFVKPLTLVKRDFVSLWQKNLAKCCSQTSLFSGSMENYMGTRATFEGIFTAVVSAKQILNVANIFIVTPSDVNIRSTRLQ